MRDPQAIREEILSLTEEYYQARFGQSRAFQPGDCWRACGEAVTPLGSCGSNPYPEDSK